MAAAIVDHQLRSNTHKTYDVHFFGDSIHTTVTHDPDIVTQWISDLGSGHRIVGLDVEWRPVFKRNARHPAATLQLCVARRCLIFQLIHAPTVPSSLVGFLSNSEYTFVGVGIKSDLKKIGKDYDGLGLDAKTVDLRSLAAEVYERKELKNSGVKGLTKVVLEKEVQKPRGVTMSRWDKRWLKPDQVQYACLDAFVCYEMGRILNAFGSTNS
ncbi:3'-5' exonuclease-like [Henckelia pumila]|uniref:3'-5' exonuclease-like n=1 Tax=Henckelia pumila TaxID=405737 RepID=UPI003C6DC80D